MRKIVHRKRDKALRKTPRAEFFAAERVVLPTMDCDRITEILIVGSCLLDDSEVKDLPSLGVTAILSLQTEEDMRKRWTEWEEKGALSARLKFRSVPVRDFDSEDLRRKLPECVITLDRMLKAGHTVYLHCAAGTGRSPTVAAAYLHWCLAWPLKREVAHVRNARDCCPNEEARCTVHNCATSWPRLPSMRRRRYTRTTTASCTRPPVNSALARPIQV